MNMEGFKLKRILYVIFLLSFLLPFNAFSEYTWEWVGPPGGSVEKLVPDPNDSSIWYAINMRKVFRSVDGTRSWLPTHLVNVTDLDVHPKTSEVIVVSRANYLSDFMFWISNDHGKTFHLNGTGRWSFQALYVHPEKENVYYAISYNSLHLTYNRGKTWHELTNVPVDFDKPYGKYQGKDCYLDDFVFKDLMIPSDEPETIYASAGPIYSCSHSYRDIFDPFLMVSRQNKPWKVLQRLKDERAFNFVNDFRTSKKYVFGTSGLQEVRKGNFIQLSSLQFYEIALYPGKFNELYALTYRSHELMKSLDGGRSWNKMPQGRNRDIWGIAVQPATATLLTSRDFSGGDGIYAITLANGSTKEANSGFNVSQCDQVEGKGQTVYAASSYLHSSLNFGKTWRDLSSKLPVLITSNRMSLKMDPRNLNTLYFTRQHLYRSQNGGASWHTFVKGAFYVGAFDPNDPSTIYLTRFNDNHVYRMTKNHPVAEKLPLESDADIHSVWIDPYNTQTMILITNSGVRKSSDGGRSIETPNFKGYIESIASLGKPNEYLMVNNRGVYRSVDGLQSVQLISEIHGGFSIHAADLIGKRFLLVTNKKLYESLDSGISWKSISLPSNTGVQGSDLVVKDITDPKFSPLYISTANGLYRGKLLN
jgi:hypothetical protein